MTFGYVMPLALAPHDTNGIVVNTLILLGIIITSMLSST